LTKMLKKTFDFHSSRLTVFLILTVLLLQSCVPAKFSGYMPTGPGELEAGYCVAGINDRLLVIANDGVIITLRAGESLKDGTINLDITLWVPAGVIVQFGAPDFVISSQEWLQPKNLTLYEITSLRTKYLPPTAALQGGQITKRLMADGSSQYYSAFIPKFKQGTLGATDLPKVNMFELQFPELRINTKKYLMRPVKFTAYTKWGAYTCAQ
jgi:hypothetical protein